MAGPSDPHADVYAPQPPAEQGRRKTAEELDADLLEAIAEIERGDYIELTREQLERCITTGEAPWPDESHG